MESEAVAAIDIGTNTVLLLVARAGPGGELEVIEDDSTTCRLGQGLARTGRLAPEAIERTLAALEDYLARARARGVQPERVRAVGTAVLRRAADAGAFLEEVRRRLGLSVEVLSEEDEARLGFAAVTADGAGRETLIVDVGGGSTEVVGEAGAVRLSAPIGAVVLTEAFLGSEGRPPVRAGGWAGLLEHVAEACRRFPADLARRAEGGPAPVVFLGGTASNLASLVLGLERFDPAAAEGQRLPARAAAEQAERLRNLSLEDRRALPIEADRAPILPAGLACAAGAFERVGAEEVRTSGRGLRYGVARELLGQVGAPRPCP